jgi:effector-binding domain-containing protein
MEFVLPSNYDLETISEPNDQDVVIFKSEAKHYACIKYGGYSNSNKFENHSRKLIKKVTEMNLVTKGDVFYVSYNSPYKIFNRRNEAMIEVVYNN